jgi:hypothetical protein
LVLGQSSIPEVRLSNSRHQVRLAAAALLVLFVAGCGRVAPTSPAAGLESAPAPSRAATPSALQLPVVGPLVNRIVRSPLFVSVTSRVALPGLPDFVTATVSPLLPGTSATVHSGAWTLDVHPGSLTAAKDISIAAASDGSLRVRFGPDGTVFGDAVDLTIDYSGTALDPSSKNYVPGLVPQFLYFDPSLNAWVEMPCTVDAANRQVHAKLQHFSQYGLGGRAGW